MLRCDNTVFRRLWRAKLRKSRILAAMSNAEDLARRFFALWGEYLTAVAGDATTLDLMRRCLAAGAIPQQTGEAGATGPASRAAAAAGASGGRDPAVAELAH